jgi:DNA-binding transcriptional MerR regulator
VRSHTIGEVLNELKDEFDDVTISKIRFLESEGLIAPDRTESGYRKFTEDDVERLRYVLRTQRDRYLPLKVIREELDRLDAGQPVEPPTPPPPPPGTAAAGDDAAGESAEEERPALVSAAPDPVELTVNELCDATGLEAGDVGALRDHGLLEGDERFDGHDLEVARAAAELMRLGLEPRHLRMYRQFADREVGIFEQLVAPLLKQRNPDARRTAETQVDELAHHGQLLYRTVVSRELRGIIHG